MVSRHSSHSMTSCPPADRCSIWGLHFWWRDVKAISPTNKRLVVTAAHSCATLTYPPSFVLLVTAVKVVMQHSPSLLSWMRSATSASPDEARKEWRRGEWCPYLSVLTFFCMSCGHGARFRTGRNFLFCYFIIFFHALSRTSNLLDWPKHVFSFLPRKGIEKGMDNIHSDVRVYTLIDRVNQNWLKAQCCSSAELSW